MGNCREATLAVDMRDNILGLIAVDPSRYANSQHVHALTAAEFESRNQHELFARELRALGHIAWQAVAIEILGMVREAREGASRGDESIAYLTKRELAVRVRAMAVQGAQKHLIPNRCASLIAVAGAGACG